jgi:hypothetical protein
VADSATRFVASSLEMPVIQPNLFFASIQYLAGPDDMLGTGAVSEYVGEYQLNEFNELGELVAQPMIVITLEAGQLYVTPVSDPKAPLFASEMDHFINAPKLR